MKIKMDLIIIVAVLYLMLYGLHCRYWKLAMSALIGILLSRILKNTIYGLIAFLASYFLLSKYIRQIEGFEEEKDENLEDFNEEDVNESEPLNDDEPEVVETKKGKKTAFQAQRETFQLVDALKELNKSIENMEPTLKEGAKVLKMMEKFNLS